MPISREVWDCCLDYDSIYHYHSIDLLIDIYFQSDLTTRNKIINSKEFKLLLNLVEQDKTSHRNKNLKYDLGIEPIRISIYTYTQEIIDIFNKNIIKWLHYKIPIDIAYLIGYELFENTMIFSIRKKILQNDFRNAIESLGKAGLLYCSKPVTIDQNSLTSIVFKKYNVENIHYVNEAIPSSIVVNRDLTKKNGFQDVNEWFLDKELILNPINFNCLKQRIKDEILSLKNDSIRKLSLECMDSFINAIDHPFENLRWILSFDLDMNSQFVYLPIIFNKMSDEDKFNYLLKINDQLEIDELRQDTFLEILKILNENGISIKDPVFAIQAIDKLLYTNVYRLGDVEVFCTFFNDNEIYEKISSLYNSLCNNDFQLALKAYQQFIMENHEKINFENTDLGLSL